MSNSPPSGRVAVYQMGRVGSRSTTLALEAAGLQVIHVHRLSLRNVEIPLSANERLRRFARRQVFRLEPVLAGGRARIVTLVRDPMKRNISSFFRNLDRFVPAGATPSIDELIALFLRQTNIHRTPATWFDEELRRHTGLDFRAAPFDGERGFQVLSHGRFDGFLARTDKISQLSGELGGFVGRELTVEKRNDLASTGISEVYSQFLDQFVPPEWMIDQLYRCEATEHFFSRAEIDRMIEGALGGKAAGEAKA